MSSQPQRLLLIEDNQGDVDLVRLKLLESNAEFEVYCADRLSAGLAALTKETPVAVLLDLYLPDSRGVDTLHAVIDRTAGVPVVVITGTDDDELALHAVSSGAQDYLVKGTFDGKRLGHSLRFAIERQTLMSSFAADKKQQPRRSATREPHAYEDTSALVPD
jgi:DNA-binding response OmpR family regulator